MNAPERLPLPDVQSTPDTRQIAIGRVGIRNVRQPVSVQSIDGSAAMTVANVDMYVGLPADQKGTHNVTGRTFAASPTAKAAG